MVSSKWKSAGYIYLMPIYEYQCKRCSHRFEKLMKMKDRKPVCPSCGRSNPSKLISRGSFILKGDGWYKDGYGLKKP